MNMYHSGCGTEQTDVVYIDCYPSGIPGLHPEQQMNSSLQSPEEQSFQYHAGLTSVIEETVFGC